MKLFLCTIILSFILFISCSLFEREDDLGFWYEIDDPTLTQDSSLVPGVWNWGWSTYYFTSTGRPAKHTPQTTGYTEKLVFKTDGTVSVYRNEELTSTHNYAIEDTWSLSFGNRKYQFGVNESKMVLSIAYVDGPEKIYFRGDE